MLAAGELAWHQLLAGHLTGSSAPISAAEAAAEQDHRQEAHRHDHDVLDRFDRIIDFKEFQEG